MTHFDDDKLTPSYPALTIDTLAFAIAMDLLFDPNNHDEFDINNNSSYDQLVEAIGDDLADLLHNGNEDDWLLCFYENDGSTQELEKLTVELDRILHRTYNRESGEGQVDYGRHNAALQEIAEKAASIIIHTRAGIPGRFGFAASE